jgi:hypothetical protein
MIESDDMNIHDLLWVIPIGWLVGWLVGWSIGWLVGQSSGWLVNPLAC